MAQRGRVNTPDVATLYATNSSRMLDSITSAGRQVRASREERFRLPMRRERGGRRAAPPTRADRLSTGIARAAAAGLASAAASPTHLLALHDRTDAAPFSEPST